MNLVFNDFTGNININQIQSLILKIQNLIKTPLKKCCYKWRRHFTMINSKFNGNAAQYGGTIL